MSNLVAIAYPDQSTADEVIATLGRLQDERSIKLDDAVVVTRDLEGKVKLHQTTGLVGRSAARGAMWGGLIGLIFLVPMIGAAVGAATGAAAAGLADVGVDDLFMKELGAKLQPGGAALILLVHSSMPERVLPAVAGFGGEVIQSSLDSATEERLRHVLEAHDATAV